MKNILNNGGATRGQKYKKFLGTGALLVSLFASPDVMGQGKPLYTQASQGRICVTKQEFKRRCGLHAIPQSQIDSVHVGENLGKNIGYRISTDKAGNTFYRIDTKGPISHDEGMAPSANSDTNVGKGMPIIMGENIPHAPENNGTELGNIKPILPPNVTQELKDAIEKFFGEFSTAQADYYYTGPTFTLELQNEELLEMTRGQIKEIPITQNEEVNNCSDYCILRMGGKVVGVADKDETMVDIVDMVLDSNGEIEGLYKMICEYKAELGESYGTMDEEMKALFAEIGDYVSSHPPYKREINSKEEFLKKNPQDCFEDVLLQSLHNEMSGNTGESSGDVNVKYGN